MEVAIYLLKVSLYGLLMWAIYCTTWRGKSMHAGSRIYLLLSAVLPLLLPFIMLQAASTGVISTVERVTLEEIEVSTVPGMQPLTNVSTMQIAAGLYLTVSLFIAIGLITSYLKLIRRIAQAHVTPHDGYRVAAGSGLGPGALGRTIFFPAADIHPDILAHELQHIRAGHRFDLWLMQLLQVVCWISPAIWLIQRELRLVHEFEADSAAIRTVNVHDYARLLVAQSLGVSQQYITHSFFNHPIKRRIMMLQQLATTARMIQTVFITALLVGTLSAGIVTAQTKRTAGSSATQGTKTEAEPSLFTQPAPDNQSAQVPGKEYKHDATITQDGRTIYKTVDEMPSYKGDLPDFLSGTLKYPDAARKKNIQGRSIIQFVVLADGAISDVTLVKSSGSALLDDEAMRVTKLMNKWSPGKKDGVPVNVYFTLPVSFKLD